MELEKKIVIAEFACIALARVCVRGLLCALLAERVCNRGNGLFAATVARRRCDSESMCDECL